MWVLRVSSLVGGMLFGVSGILLLILLLLYKHRYIYPINKQFVTNVLPYFIIIMIAIL